MVTLDDACARRVAARQAGETVVFTNGCFDILHAGHVTLLDDARAMGDVLIVGLNSDDSVRRLKGASRPLVPEEQRARVLCALRAVDMVVVFDEDTPARVIEALVPDVLVKGGDYTPDDVVGRDVVEAHGGRVAIVPLVPSVSTTEIAARVTR